MADKQLYRSSSDRMIAGVCGGIAQHFGWDPVLVRLAAVALLFVTNGGAGIAYLVMAAIVPEEPVGEAGAPMMPSQRPETAVSEPARRPGVVWIGGALVVVGLAFLADQVFGIDVWRFWPVLLVLAGVRMIAGGMRS